jgi:thioredoxin 1
LALEFTDENFAAEVLSSTTPVVVDFSATWCGPCKALAPIIDQLAKEYAGRIKIGKVDVDQAQDTAQKFGILSVPTVIYFKDGKVVDRDVGLNAKAVYQKKIDALV